MARHVVRPVLALFMMAGASLGSPTANASPTAHEELPAESLILHCADGTTYTGTSGALNFSSREGASSSGNERFGGTVTLDHVVVSDGVHTFRAVGAASFSGGTNAQTGTVSDRGNFDIHILDADGPVARVRINARLMNDGSIWVNDQGDCEQPD